mgnify:CR=1 FL=1
MPPLAGAVGEADWGGREYRGVKHSTTLRRYAPPPGVTCDVHLRALLWIAHRAIHPAGACTSGTADLLFPAIFWVFGRLSVRTIGCFRSVSLTFLHYFVDISCGCSNNCPLFTTRLHPMFTYPRITFKVTPHSGRNKRQTYLSHSQGGVSNVQYPIITRHGQRRHVAGAG